MVAEDRLLLPGVRLRRLRLRPVVSGSLGDLLSGGPGRVRRLLGRPVEVERCEIELRAEAMEELLRRALRGSTVAGLTVTRVDLELVEGREELLLHLALRDRFGVRVDWGARIALVPRRSCLCLHARTLWASPNGRDPYLVWRALLARALCARGVSLQGEHLSVDPLGLWLDRWLVLGGHRPLRLSADVGLQLQPRGYGSLDVLIGERVESRAPSTAAPAQGIADAPARILRGIEAGKGAQVYEELAELGGDALPESAVWEIASLAEDLGQACAALELAAGRGSGRAEARLAVTRGRAGDRSGLVEMLERAWRVASHPVVQARLRIAWALTLATEADAVGRARRELEGLVAEIGDGGWPSSITGEAWAALAKLRAGDPEVRGELVLAAAFEASHHMGGSRGGETLLEVAVDLFERSDVDVVFARRARAAGEALVANPDSALVDRLRNWRSRSETELA